MMMNVGEEVHKAKKVISMAYIEKKIWLLLEWG